MSPIHHLYTLYIRSPYTPYTPLYTVYSDLYTARAWSRALCILYTYTPYTIHTYTLYTYTPIPLKVRPRLVPFSVRHLSYRGIQLFVRESVRVATATSRWPVDSLHAY